jgi:hypothetical protein
MVRERSATSADHSASSVGLLGDEDPEVLSSDLPDRLSGGFVVDEWARQDAWARRAGPAWRRYGRRSPLSVALAARGGARRV